jgi:small subunit ribosomal protein S20
MPHTKSAWKRLRQTEKRRARNRRVTKVLKLKVRDVRATIAKGDVSTAETELKAAIQKLDQAAAKRYIHPNKAARLKSRLTKRFEAAKQTVKA